jgi:hypothetical protein
MEVLDYLQNCIKTDIAPSPIHGIGTFALRDMEVGEPVFVGWTGDTRVYTLTFEEFDSLPIYTQKLILKSYENKRNEFPVIWFRLFKGSYFNLSNPWAYTNTAEENGNVDSVKRIVVKPIKAGEEILGTYKLSNTII